MDQKPVVEFMPSPLELQGEFVKKGLTGIAVIGFTVSAEGKTEQIKIVQSTDAELARLSVAYVARLVFHPASAAGSPVACEVEMPFFQQ